ncbi:MAG TPA: alpha-L-rhamnosidase C-terminal domain-containing protein, partial [Microbacterium sp.]|nr:alpha-L-rhamnosidase C-terminal domain-containing protein [Microbacterium sp.]
AETVVTASPDQVLVDWPVAPLASRERAHVRVRVAGHDDVWSQWSPATVTEAGLLSPDDWSARPVGAAWPEDGESDDRRPSLVRREFSTRGGPAPGAPGYRVVSFAPRPGGGLTSASARHRTPYGEASISWRVEEDRLVVAVHVPVGATGVLELPGLPAEIIPHGTHHRDTAVLVALA